MITVRKFWTFRPNDIEPVLHESETIPDQSLSVRDILLRFTRGQMVMPPIETGDDSDIDEIDYDDMISAQEQVNYGREVIAEMRETQIRNDNPANLPDAVDDPSPEGSV